MDDIYICPTCEEKNEEHRKYCKTCGTWLLSTNFPAKKLVKNKKSATGKGMSSIIILLAVIGAAWFFATNGLTNPLIDKLTFGHIDVGPYSFSQLEITSGVKTSVPVDLYVREATSDPVEISAVFYTEDGTRIARASAIIMNAMEAGYTTTLNLKLDQPVSLIAARSVHMEVKPLAPFELLEKAVDALRSQ